MSNTDTGLSQLLAFMGTVSVVRGLYNGRKVRLKKRYVLNEHVVPGGSVGTVVDLRVSTQAPLVVQFDSGIIFNPDAKDIEFIK